MFTGIIEATGKVKAAKSVRGNRVLEIGKPRAWKLANGQSVSVDGICSTVVSSTPDTFRVEYMPETLKKTTAGGFLRGTRVNLERSLTLEKFVDGHLVLGHVDGKARVVGAVDNSNGYLLTISLPAEISDYIALHGSFALNGVSLTVARKGARTATVALIPHTLSHTNLGSLKKGDYANLEIDLIARYALPFLKKQKQKEV